MSGPRTTHFIGGDGECNAGLAVTYKLNGNFGAAVAWWRPARRHPGPVNNEDGDFAAKPGTDEQIVFGLGCRATGGHAIAPRQKRTTHEAPGSAEL